MWIAEDNSAVSSIDLHYSTDGGISWDVIANDELNDSIYEWIIPNEPSENV